MKTVNGKVASSILAVAAVSLIFGASLTSRKVKADDSEWLFALGTDGANFSQNGRDTQLQCQFYLGTTAGALSSFTIKCNDPADPDKTFTLDQIQSNQVIKQKSGHKVAQLKTDPGFDPVHGGTLTLTYLKSGSLNASSDQYATYQLEIQNAGSKFEILTGPNNGQKVFNYMFMKAHKNFLGIVTGIDSIQTQYNANGAPSGNLELQNSRASQLDVS